MHNVKDDSSWSQVPLGEAKENSFPHAISEKLSAQMILKHSKALADEDNDGGEFVVPTIPIFVGAQHS